MDLESQLQLSYYREIALLNENHRVWLVQHTETQKIYVKKALEVYCRRLQVPWAMPTILRI